MSEENGKVVTSVKKDKNKMLSKYESFIKKKNKNNLADFSMSDIIKTGLEPFDTVIGGIPLGTIVSITAKAGIGKSTLAQQIGSAIQKQSDAILAYIDHEGTVSERRSLELGLDLDSLLPLNPNTLEETYAMMFDMLEKKISDNDDMPIVFIWDSTASSSTMDELKKADTADTAQIGSQARIHSTKLPMLRNKLKDANCTLIAINQYRKNIGGGGNAFFKQKEEDEHVVKGGDALTYYPAIDIRMRAGKSKLEESWGTEGKVARVKALKNRIASPNVEFEFVLDYETGFNSAYSIFLMLKDLTVKQRKRSNLEELLSFGSGGKYWKLKFGKPIKNEKGEIIWYDSSTGEELDNKLDIIKYGTVKLESEYEKSVMAKDWREEYDKDGEFREVLKDLLLILYTKKAI